MKRHFANLPKVMKETKVLENKFEINAFDPHELGLRLHMLPCSNPECAKEGGTLNYSYKVKNGKVVGGRVACFRCHRVINLTTAKLIIVTNETGSNNG